MSLRAVLDTNVVLAARRSTSVVSPNAEIVSRWRPNRFYGHSSGNQGGATFLSPGKPSPTNRATGMSPLLEPSTERNPLGCPIDTYDEHLRLVGVFYPEFKTCGPLDFLNDLRKEPLS